MNDNNTTASSSELFPAVPERFLELLFQHCDKESAASIINGGTYLKRLAELGMLDLDGLCEQLNYTFFAGNTTLTPDLFGQFNISEIVEYIKERSILGSVL